MKRFGVQGALVAALLAVLGVGSYAIAGGSSNSIRAERLHGYNEVPSVSTVASGRFRATVGPNDVVTYHLSYSNIEGDVTQAHIHFGQRDVNGGISVWLCSDLASPPTPAGTPDCPETPGSVTGTSSGSLTGTFDASDVVGPASQGIEPMALGELFRAIRAGKAYANVHSSKFPGGEIRAQIGQRGGGDGDDD